MLHDEPAIDQNSTAELYAYSERKCHRPRITQATTHRYAHPSNKSGIYRKHSMTQTRIVPPQKSETVKSSGSHPKWSTSFLVLCPTTE